MLIHLGIQPKVISERLGHASIKITMDLYGYLMPGLQEAVADALEGLG
jgi:integrase